MSNLLFSAADIAELRALEQSAMPDTVVITTPGALVDDGAGGRLPGTPSTLATVGVLVPLGQTPQELTIASRAAGSQVVAVLVPANTSVSDQATLTINGTVTVQILGVITYGTWETSRRIVGKVII